MATKYSIMYITREAGQIDKEASITGPFSHPARHAQPSLACAVGLGVAMAEVSICIVHDTNHGSGVGCGVLRYALSATLDVLGASSFMWRQQHLVGHHAFTNVPDADPDIRVNDPDVRRVIATQPRHTYHVRAHTAG